jgi:hypothetical protein
MGCAGISTRMLSLIFCRSYWKKNILIGIRVRRPMLGASYSVLYNDSLNLVVPQSLRENVAGSFQNGKIEFKYHPPYLKVDVQCSQFVVGGSVDPPTENLRSQLAPVREPVQCGDLRLEDIELHIGYVSSLVPRCSV